MGAHAAIYAARKQLGMDDDMARDLYQRVTGKRSLRDMNDNERRDVVGAMRAAGFQPGNSKGNKGLTGKYAKKLQALWIAGWNLGLMRVKTDKALIAFVKRQTGIDHVRFLRDPDDANKAVEALKGWLRRSGGVDWSESQFDPPYACTPGFKIAWAQWLRLGNDAHAHSTHRFWNTVADLIGSPVDFETGPTNAQWITVMNALGERVRAGRK